MKITPKILFIPPYLSAAWSQISALYMLDNQLVVYLTDGVKIAIPHLNASEIEAIFEAHALFTEKTSNSHPNQQTTLQFLNHLPNASSVSPQQGQNPEGLAAMHFNLDSMESFSSALRHNQEHAHLSDLPAEILNKIAAIAKIVAPGDIQNMPKPEPHCNCPHCQIARAIHGLEKQEPRNSEALLNQEEEISEKDLFFPQWNINQTGDKLYVVTNCLDNNEKYNVFLGDPIGCTCGLSGCEHILAVLKS